MRWTLEVSLFSEDPFLVECFFFWGGDGFLNSYLEIWTMASPMSLPSSVLIYPHGGVPIFSYPLPFIFFPPPKVSWVCIIMYISSLMYFIIQLLKTLVYRCVNINLHGDGIQMIKQQTTWWQPGNRRLRTVMLLIPRNVEGAEGCSTELWNAFAVMPFVVCWTNDSAAEMHVLGVLIWFGCLALLYFTCMGLVLMLGFYFNMVMVCRHFLPLPSFF